jgi:hypothetical protein
LSGTISMRALALSRATSGTGMPTLGQRIEKRLVNRNYARLWYGQAISSVGNHVFDTTMTLRVAAKLGAGKPWAPAAVSGWL